MKNLRISSKLLVAFGTLGAVLIGLVVFASWQMSTMNAKASDIAFNRMEKVTLADDLATAIAKFRAAEGAHVLSTDPATMDRIAAKKDVARGIANARLAKLNEIVALPQAKAMLATIADRWPGYLELDTRLMALSRQNQNVEAGALLGGPMMAKFDEMAKAADDLSNLQGQLGREAAQDNATTYERARMLMMIALVVALGGMAAILFLLIRQIARPVSGATAALSELAAGKMDVIVPDSDRADEVGALAKALGGLRDQLAAAERAKAEQTALIVESIGKGLSGLAEGDLISRVDVELTGPFAKLKADFNNAAEALQATMVQVSHAASGINGGAADIRQASDDLSQRTEQQAASLEETAATMDEITATVRSTAARATSADEAVKGMRELAERSGAVVREAVQAMGGIERTSNEISEIISVIDGIAFQTNLLALNAGVEAARAGDAGKGFAVVASEVRALAQRSADAAKDVKSRITASSEQVAAGVRLVDQTGHALSEIIDRIGGVSGMVSDIASAAEQQATGLHQVNTAVSEMDGVTQQNAAMVEEATAAARSLADEADSLSQQIARFRTGNVASASVSPVHQLQERAAVAGRRIARVASTRTLGNTALAAEADWSEF
ncbi:methyl-accepting chemotaxis protein [Sphingomonas sp. Leaf21]|uniref:methyl-accepting chemotaxis protein n=1 Tax=Sphingomonas sp. Leaf21 TaxID=2876550 RepID=UPI001E4D7EB8|nr:methyl-accepting chemotaxis protein [Sphingomonas sp. Leaf21]